MRGDAQIIEILNEILTAELTAINQYFVHAQDVRELGLQAPRTRRSGTSRSTR